MDEDPSRLDERETPESLKQDSTSPAGASRRRVLRTLSAVGAAGFVLPTGTGIAAGVPESVLKTGADSYVHRVYETAEVTTLIDSYPELDFTFKSVMALRVDADDNIRAAEFTAVDGVLTYFHAKGACYAALALDDSLRKSLRDWDWPQQTTGRVEATATEAKFVRTVTVHEERAFLRRLGATKLGRPDTNRLLFTPDEATYHADRLDFTSRAVEALTVVDIERGERKPDKQKQAKNGLIIVEQAVYGGDSGEEMTAMSGCRLSSRQAADLILCLYQLASCRFCLLSALGGPAVTLACILLLCFGSPAALEALLPQLDNSCVSLATKTISCWDTVTSYY